MVTFAFLSVSNGAAGCAAQPAALALRAIAPRPRAERQIDSATEVLGVALMCNPLPSLGQFTKVLPLVAVMPRFLRAFLSLSRVVVCGMWLGLGAAPAFGQESLTEAKQAAEAKRAQPQEVLARPEGPRLIWDPAWPKFRTSEWVATGVGFGALLASKLVPQPTAHWQGGILFDEGVRDALRVSDFNGRQWAQDMSDIGVTLSESWPFIDSLVVAGWYRKSPEVGVQQALISAEALAVTAGLQGIVSSLASRERPYGRECGGELDLQSRDCTSRDRFWSFYSGHASQAFTGAAVTCMNHAYVPLYGGGAADTAACAAALGVAGATAFLRISTDAHYASDVLMGALLGTATGLLVPWALHYRSGSASERVDANAPHFMLVPFGLGAAGVLVF